MSKQNIRIVRPEGKTDAVIRKSLLWTATELGTDGSSYVVLGKRIPVCYHKRR